jgi:cold-inducible RNA-binding protein
MAELEAGTMNRKLFVGNLSFSTEERTLEELFGQAGNVTSVRVMRDQATGRARGFGFVEMETEEAAQAAIDKFNNAEVDGRRIAVNEARPQVGGGQRFGGGGGRGYSGERSGGGGNGGGFGGRRREPRW